MKAGKKPKCTDTQLLDYLSLLGNHGFEMLASDIWRLHKDGETIGAGQGVRGAIASAMDAGVGEPPRVIKSEDVFTS